MHEPSNSGAPFSRPTQSRRINRLSIADLFLITLGTAIAIWFWLPLRDTLNAPQMGIIVAFAPLYGSAIAAVFISAFRAHKNLAPFASQPGHWLLLLIGYLTIALGLFPKGEPLLSDNPQKLEGLIPIIQVMCALAAIVLLLFSAALLLSMAFGPVEESPRWRWTFQLLVATAAIPFVGGCLGPVATDVMPLTVVALIVFFAIPVALLGSSIAAVGEDVLHRVPRDFWHWLGVAAYFGVPIQIVLLSIVTMYSR